MKPLIIIDTETTGVPAQWFCRVIEFAAVAVDENGVIVSSFDSLVYPDTFEPGRSKHAMAVNGLDPNAFYYAPRVHEVDGRFQEWRKSVGDLPCTSWPVSFEQAVLTQSGFSFIPWTFCLKKLIAGAHGGMGSNKAAEFFGVEVAQPKHRALPDAITEARIWAAHCRKVGEAAIPPAQTIIPW